MGIQIDNTNLQNGVINNLYTKVQGYTSQFLNTDTREFASYLKKNYDSIDQNADNALSQEEVSAAVKRDSRSEELKKLIDNTSLEKMFANIDTDENGSISFSETNPNGNLSGIVKSAYNEIQADSQNWKNAAMNLTQNLCKNYYASSALTSLATGAVSALV